MFAPLLGAIRADIDRQVGWAKDEVRRQTRYATLTGVLAGVAALAALGATVVALIALYLWLAMRADPFTALGVMGGGLLLVSVLLFALAFIRRRPRLVARPQLQIAQPAALLGTLRPRPFPDRERILIEALNSEDFITLPRIAGPVRTIKVRFNLRTGEEWVDLYTDSDIVTVSDHLLFLLPPPPDAFSALVNFLKVYGDTRSKEEAFNAVHAQFPDYTDYAINRDWVPARVAARLPPKADSGRKRKREKL